METVFVCLITEESINWQCVPGADLTIILNPICLFIA